MKKLRIFIIVILLGINILCFANKEIHCLNSCNIFGFRCILKVINCSIKLVFFHLKFLTTVELLSLFTSFLMLFISVVRFKVCPSSDSFLSVLVFFF